MCQIIWFVNGFFMNKTEKTCASGPKNPKITQLGVCFSVQHWYTRSQEREIPNPLSICTGSKLKCHHWMLRVPFLARTCEFQAWNMMSPHGTGDHRWHIMWQKTEPPPPRPWFPDGSNNRTWISPPKTVVIWAQLKAAQMPNKQSWVQYTKDEVKHSHLREVITIKNLILCTCEYVVFV